MARVDDLEYERRVRQVQEWILQGNLNADIIKSIAAKWGIEKRQAYNYLRDAQKGFLEVTKGELEERVSFHIAARLKLFKDLENKTKPFNASIANQILDGMARIEGLHVKKVDITTKGDKIESGSSMTDEQFEKLLDAARKDTINTDQGE